MPRLALALLLLLSCGPEPIQPVHASAKITNEYAESLFALKVTPLDGGTVTLFSSERIASGKSASSKEFEVPIASDGMVDFELTGTSLGEDHGFTGRRKLRTGEVLLLVYDYDLAVARFRVDVSVE